MTQTLTAPNVMVCDCSCASQAARTACVLTMPFPPPAWIAGLLSPASRAGPAGAHSCYPTECFGSGNSAAGFVLQEVLTLDVCWGEVGGREGGQQEAAAGIRRGPGLDCAGWRGWAGRAGLEERNISYILKE